MQNNKYSILKQMILATDFIQVTTTYYVKYEQLINKLRFQPYLETRKETVKNSMVQNCKSLVKRLTFSCDNQNVVHA